MWYVLHVLTGQETDISHRLLQQGFKTLVPIEGRMIHTHSKWVKMDYTLLPGYVFVAATMNDSIYYQLNEADGVIRILGVDRKPTPLSEKDVEWLLNLSSCIKEPTTVEYLDNHTYRIVSGFLKHNTGCIEHLDRHRRRIRIKLLLFGEAKRLELSYKIALAKL